MKPSIPEVFDKPPMERLTAALEEYERQYPGDRAGRQPVHTVYGGAHLFKRDIVARVGKIARAAFAKYAATPQSLALVFPIAPANSKALYDRVWEKLEKEPLEDYRIDFEDGYGIRSDDEEDGHARTAACELAEGLNAGVLPASIGIRIKSLSVDTALRALRTLELFVIQLLDRTSGRLPENFVVTLPKVIVPEQASLLCERLAKYEAESGLQAGAVGVELMVETPNALIGADGSSALLRMIDATNGRCRGVHFGAFDYLAYCGIPAAEQALSHKACDFARGCLLTLIAGRGINLADGVTTFLPIEKHKGVLTEEQARENHEAVTNAWRAHFLNVRHSLSSGYFQSWDLHPAQIPARYAAIFDFFLTNLDESAARLSNFIARAAQATTVGTIFDDAASAQGLLNFFLRAVNCAAISEADLHRLTGLSIDEIRTGSFIQILQNRSLA